ncbi:GGDEF domain-containing protein [Sphingomonas naphthae]|uniref:diguanylate cyclase n=1 Tax=Sphingomonas naphthae TaxID=1813468 RepID=A0ABY7TN27_9SPHN|nr:GGDEF domain-containing protein [Sphingomonas naphthae]WCT74641.1 GGDEF domain-containing protein [Sphingomonas naphthae]
MLVALVTISAMIAVILAIAWRDFGRPRHALTWAIGFTLASVAWGMAIVQLAAPDFAWLLAIMATGLTAWSNAAVAIGYRQRGSQPPLVWPLVGLGAIVTFADAVLAGVGGLEGLRAAIPVLFATFTMGLAASALTGRRAGERAAERVTMLVLLTLAMFHLVTAALALTVSGPELHGDLAVFMQARLLVTPAALTATGLFSVFLLAADLADRMRRLAASDPLTGILNRRGFEEAAMLLLDSARRQGRPVTLVLADIDRFKQINDAHGHAAGDRALQLFAERVGASIRRRDLFGRIGGEEFAIILPDTPIEDARVAIDKLRLEVAGYDAGELAEPVPITASFGITAFRPGEDRTLAKMMARADSALYSSKRGGRNMVTLIA